MKSKEDTMTDITGSIDGMVLGPQTADTEDLRQPLVLIDWWEAILVFLTTSYTSFDNLMASPTVNKPRFVWYSPVICYFGRHPVQARTRPEHKR